MPRITRLRLGSPSADVLRDCQIFSDLETGVECVQVVLNFPPNPSRYNGFKVASTARRVVRSCLMQNSLIQQSFFNRTVESKLLEVFA